MNRIFYRYIALTLISSIFFACKKFVTIPPPSTQLTNTSVFSSDQTATAAQLAIYADGFMRSLSWQISQNCGLLADELSNTNSIDATVVGCYTNTLPITADAGPWAASYNYIYAINSIIEGINNSSITWNVNVKNQLLGESRFLRAFFYFYLVNCYGDVPLVLTTDYKINSKLARSPKKDVYAAMLGDLHFAYSSLSGHFVDATDTAFTPQRVRPTKWAAAALLARTYLFTGSYDSAEIYSSKVIDGAGGVFKLCDNVDSVFMMNSNEAIWQLGSLDIPFNNTFDGDNFVLVADPGLGQYECCYH